MSPEIESTVAEAGPNRPVALRMALVVDAMIVASLLVIYLMVDAPSADWRGGAPAAGLAAMMTVLLAGAASAAWRARANSVERAKRWLAFGAFCAFLFVVLKLSEYRLAFISGIEPLATPFLAVYTALMVVHLLHVIGGAAANAWIIASAVTGGLERTDTRARALSIYWMAVLAFWVVLLLMFY